MISNFLKRVFKIKTLSKREAFLKDVEYEIRQLKRYAMADELARLNFEMLYPESKSDCIYGQLTGSCASNRAKELMNVSCIRVVHARVGEEGGTKTIIGLDITDDHFVVNGTYKGQTWNDFQFNPRDYYYLSALEAYICTKNANNAGIIAWLRGETEEFPVL